MKHEIEQSVSGIDIESETGTVRAQLCFHADLEVFRGHFPEIALVPGIYLIEATRVLAERLTSETLQIDEVANARFTAEVHPDDDISAAATVTRDAGGWICEAAFDVDEIKVAKVRLVLAAL